MSLLYTPERYADGQTAQYLGKCGAGSGQVINTPSLAWEKKNLYSLPTLCGMLCLQPFFKKLNLGIYSYACHELQQNGENQLCGTTFRTQLKWQGTEQLLGHCYQNIDNKTLFCLRGTLLSVRKSSSCILSIATQGLDTGKLHFLKTPALTRGI